MSAPLPSVTPIRVLHVIEAMHRGGAESLVVEHVRHAGPGVHVQVCAINRGGPALEEARALGAKVFVLRKGGGLLSRLRAVGALGRYVRENGITVVNGHNPSGGLYAWLAARGARVAWVRTEHSLHYRGRHSPLYPVIERLSTASARHVVCVCDAVRRSHVAVMRSRADRYVTVLNGIAPATVSESRLAMRKSLGLEEGVPVALAVGSLTPQKDHLALLDAFTRVARELPGARLLIAGEGALEAALAGRVARLGLAGRVRLLGPREDVAELLEAADLFVLSSVREGLPVTLLEAMRAGRPSVVTSIGGCPEAVRDGETGRLVPVGDPGALAAAMTEMLRDPARRAAMGAAARARWSREFTAARMVAETEAVYRSALGARNAGLAKAPRVEGRRASA